MMMLTPSRKGVAMTSTLLSLRTASLNFLISDPSSSFSSVYGRPCGTHVRAVIRYQLQRYNVVLASCITWTCDLADVGVHCTFMRVLSAMMAPPGTIRLLSMSYIEKRGPNQPATPS